MSIVPPRTMPGLLELLPRDQVSLQRMLDVIRSGYERFGYLPIQTPTMELAEVLLQKGGGETERQVYFAQSTGAAAQGRTPDLALRFDLTVPLARYVAEHEADLFFPFKRYQIQTVFRGEAPQRGRFREFYQCDIDVIGRDSLSLRYDAEIPAVIDRVFTDLAIGDFVISLNNRRLLRGLLHQLGVVDNQEAVLRQLDKLDKRDVDAVGISLIEVGMSTGAAERLLELTARGVVNGDSALELLDSISPDNPTLAEGLAELAEVIRLIGDLGVPADRYGVDLSIARGLDYYTGTVYETTLLSHPDLGSICSGGRYDDLAGHYTTSRLPGVGISIGLSRLFWQLREAGLLDPTGSTIQVLVGLIDDDGLAVALQIATQLRQYGINTETVMERSKLGRQLKYADRAEIRFLVLAGPDERARGDAMIRDLRLQNQHNVPISGVGAALASMLNKGGS